MQKIHHEGFMKIKFRFLFFLGLCALLFNACSETEKQFKDRIIGRYYTINSQLDSVCLSFYDDQTFEYYLKIDGKREYYQTGDFQIIKFGSRYSINMNIVLGYRLSFIGANDPVGISFFVSELDANCITMKGEDEYYSPDETFCRL